jgi:hypothetical protein
MLDGANVGSEDVTPPYSVVWNTAASSNGAHSLTAVARDASNNQASAAVVVVNVNNAGPPATAPPEPAGEPTSSYSIPENGGQLLSTTDAAGPMQIGYARVQPSGGNTSPAGVAILAYRSGGVLVSEAGVPASPSFRSGRIFADLDGSVRTGVAFANSNHQDAVISFYFTDRAGSDLGHGTFTLAANRQLAAFLDELPFGGPKPFQGSFTFSVSVGVSVIALRGLTNERNEFLITTLPVSPLGEGLFEGMTVLPHFADGGGWTTQIILTNPGDTPLSGTLQFFGQGAPGENAPVLRMLLNGVDRYSFSYTIAQRASISVSTSNAENVVRVGSVRVTPSAGSGGPSAVSIFSFRTNGITVSEGSAAGDREATAFRIYVESVGRPPATGSTQTSLAIANPAALSVALTLELSRLDGSRWGGPVSLVIPPGGQIARFINELFPGLPASFQGILRVVSTFPVRLVGLRGRYNERGDFLITTTPPWDESIANTAEVVFPHVVNGDGYTTQFIMMGQPGTGRIWLVSREGVLVQSESLTHP